MLLLLPPSEGKAAHGEPEPRSLSFPHLDEAREQVLEALITVSSGPDALAVLGLSAGQSGEAARNRELRTAGTLPAAQRYTGVLYENLGLSTLGAAAARRAQEQVIIFSGLWGALRPADRIPPYRLSMAVKLPPLGSLAAFWRPVLTPVLDAEPGLAVDLRSAAYAQAWRPGERAVKVRVLREQGGRRTVVSHMAKATRGAVARSLLEEGADPSSPEELVKILGDLGYTAELSDPPRRGESWTVDVVIHS